MDRDQLAELLHTKKISSIALTEMYLERLKRYDPALHFVVTLTTDRATAQARITAVTALARRP